MAAKRKTPNTSSKKIHPIIMYPFTQPKNTSDLEILYTDLIKPLNDNPEKYATPITIINRQTFHKSMDWVYTEDSKTLIDNFLNEFVKPVSKLEKVWSVDTCQMWLDGFGMAYGENSTGEDVYWLIPGDFEYSKIDAETKTETTNGKKQKDDELSVFEKMMQIPDIVFYKNQDLCIGEIKVNPNNSKQLIDTYGTYGLLYNWFPYLAKTIRLITSKPRSEFFAIKHSFLGEILERRWYAYEQTTIMLLQAVDQKKHVHKVELGEINDIPQGRDSLASAIMQVERTERALKLYWREKNIDDIEWPNKFKLLDSQSAQIRGAALVILENFLFPPKS